MFLVIIMCGPYFRCVLHQHYYCELERVQPCVEVVHQRLLSMHRQLQVGLFVATVGKEEPRARLGRVLQISVLLVVSVFLKCTSSRPLLRQLCRVTSDLNFTREP